MSEPDIQAFNSPAAWRPLDYPTKDAFAIDLEEHQIAALEAELDRFKTNRDDHVDLNPENFPLTDIADEIVEWRRHVHEGRGMILLRGIPVDRISIEDLKLIYLGLGSHFGRPVSQSNMGDLVGDVINIGDKDPKERAYRSSRELMLHTDRADHIAMLCIRRAVQGGFSRYASALTIHNVMLLERPDLLPYLYRGFYHHRFGEQPPGEPIVTRERIPVFSVTDGVPSVIFIRGYINLAAEEGHVELSEDELEALDLMEEISNRPDVRLDFMMEPGELIFVNNCLIMHSRTSFEDSNDPSLRRHLLRLWLREDDRPAAGGVLMHKGKAGIEKQEGKGTYYNNNDVGDAFEASIPRNDMSLS
ncbi:MAG: TauD/TfdA family dioxygenase [Pseudomonadota bacterium]|nr:TauD/TfdA family dioxygenase [Pseudomonadota bacterium]